jgi:hypothetical protein
MSLTNCFTEMLDFDVTHFVGPQICKGSIGETDYSDEVVLRTEMGLPTVRADHISAFIEHPYAEQK